MLAFPCARSPPLCAFDLLTTTHTSRHTGRHCHGCRHLRRYFSLEKRCQTTFNGYLRAGTILHNFTNALALLTELRLACDSPLLSRNTRKLYAQQRFLVQDDGEELPEFLSIGQGNVDGEAAGGPPVVTLPPAVMQRLQKGEIDPECSICLDHPAWAVSVITQCGHMFCRECIEGCMQDMVPGDPDDRQGLCPNCRTNTLKHQLVPGKQVRVCSYALA